MAVAEKPIEVASAASNELIFNSFHSSAITATFSSTTGRIVFSCRGSCQPANCERIERGLREHAFPHAAHVEVDAGDVPLQQHDAQAQRAT